MKQVIGFTEKFYTLWTYECIRVHVSQLQGYDRHIWTFIQNLSFDLQKAIEKAPNAEIDLSQKGSKSFTELKDFQCYPDEQMWFGQHKGALIADISESYINWLISKCDDLPRIIRHSKIARDIIAKIEAEKFAEEKRISEIEVLPNETSIDVLFDKNLSIVGEYFGENLDNWKATHGAYNFALKGLSVCLLFENYKEMDYNGHPYALPCIKGKAKRLKNKTLKLSLSDGTIEVSKIGKTQTFIVKNFEII